MHLIFFKKGGKNKSFVEEGTSERRVCPRKGRMKLNMVDVFCIHM
jgi:hypothetical protein